MRILVGTGDGLHELAADGSPGPVHHAGRVVTAVAAEYPGFWAILDQTDVWHTDQGGRWIHRGTVDGIRANCLADTRAGYLVGTSEAHLYRVEDGRLERVDSFDRVDGRDRWYTPWGGPPDSRSITEDRDTVYVNVHVGGVVRTLDEGATWEPTLDIDWDVHRVWAWGGGVFAACALGLAVSRDRGASWTIRDEGLHATYCRGVAVAGDSVLVSASNGPRGGDSAVYRGAAEGGPFERCRRGLPDRFDRNVDSACLDAIPSDGVAAFGTEDGRVFLSDDEGLTWTEVASRLSPVRCVLVMPGG
jgi:hypothetical protein